MCNGYRTVLAQQQIGQGFTNDVRAPQNDGIQAGKIIAQRMSQQYNTTLGRAWNQGVAAIPKTPGIDFVEAVDILVRVYGGQHRGAINMPWQRQLNQYAVNARIGIQFRDQRQQLLLWNVCRSIVFI